MEGGSLEVVKAYEQYIRQLDDRRIPGQERPSTQWRPLVARARAAGCAPGRAGRRRRAAGGLVRRACCCARVGRRGPRCDLGRRAPGREPGALRIRRARRRRLVIARRGRRRVLPAALGERPSGGRSGHLQRPRARGRQRLGSQLEHRSSANPSAKAELWLGESATVLGDVQPSGDWSRIRFPLREGYELPEARARERRAADTGVPGAKAYHWPGEGSIHITETHPSWTPTKAVTRRVRGRLRATVESRF